MLARGHAISGAAGWLGLPKWLAFKTGGTAEKVLSVGMIGGGMAAGWVLLAG
ncbi:MAG TPA: hypothetical protein VGW74_06380 [Propionibacteriaceae bacterium]|nr:hypothetical protein [Propionibacteriaceae bacterium]